MLTDEQCQAIAQLVEQYERLPDTERRRYSETDTRTNFIDRLFLALGWPVYDRDHVERETTVAEGKRPDYIFKLHAIPHLFLEAKPLRDDIYNLEYARDAITKAYNKGVPWAGVTNFTHLVIFDAQEELATGAQPRRVLDLTHADYPHPEGGLHFLTPQALDDRLLDEQAQRTGVRRRPVPIEKRLYESMRSWRESLFNAISGVHQWRTDEQLRHGDEAIQRLIDRLIFLRNCEDRGIGTTDLRALLNRIRSRDRNVRVTQSLLRLFAEAARTYDSELFQTDALIDVLLRPLGTILDDTLAEMIEALYSVPRSYAEYNFAEMEPDVLGQVYEQYLGYVPQRVRHLAAQQPLPGMPAPEITVEAKRQRRKEHGIYYTPRWVVHYIVQQTLGRFLLENRNNEEAIANLTVLDPACGSGSFLIHAYETLLQHHAARMRGDVAHLDTRTREWILTHNIFGVDIDPQAVEIARLNLLIRMVRQQELLPPLADNIRLGNSLISGAEDELRPYFGDAWQDKRPFNWDEEFPDIKAQGGFDIVIGNPPYVGFHGFEEDKPYLRENYATARSRFDLYIPFVERAYQLLKPGGLFGFICPTNFMKRAHGQALRDLLRTHTTILSVHDFQDQRAFEGPLNYTGILVFRKSAPRPVHTLRYSCRDLGGQFFEYSQAKLAPDTWVFRDPKSETLVHKAMEVPTAALGEITQAVAEGIVTGKNEVFLLTQGDVAQHNIEEAIIRKAVRGRHIKRYVVSWDGTCVMYPYRRVGAKTEPIPEDDLVARFPNAHRYLVASRPNLEGRAYFARSPKLWYELWCERDMGHQAALKLLTPELADANKFALCPNEVFYLDTACGITLREDVGESLLFLLGLLNSAWANYYYRSTTVPKANGFLIYKTMYLRNFPVRRIDFGNGRERTAHDQLVALVERMLDLHHRLAAKGDVHDNEREQIERDIARTDREIDDLVYDLYGLTAEERALIEAEIRR